MIPEEQENTFDDDSTKIEMTDLCNIWFGAVRAYANGKILRCFLHASGRGFGKWSDIFSFRSKQRRHEGRSRELAVVRGTHVTSNSVMMETPQNDIDGNSPFSAQEEGYVIQP